VDFDPGAGVFTMAGTGSFYSAFLMKLDSSGAYIWAKSMLTTVASVGYDLKLDAAGNIFMVGITRGTTDFDPGAGVANLSGYYEVYIGKYTHSGDLIWVKKFNGNNINTCAHFELDSLGNSYLAGTFQGTTDFNPGTGIFNLSSSSGNTAFICKLDSAGNFGWAKKIGGTSAVDSRGICIDRSGNLYIIGHSSGTTDFDPGPGTYTLAAASGSWDMFVLKLSAAGNFVWVRRTNNSYNKAVFSICIDRDDNLYTCGYFTQTTDFDPGPGIFNMTTMGIAESFVTRLDSSGSFIWARQLNGVSSSRELHVDNADNIYVGGTFSTGPVDFDPGPGTAIFSPNSFSDVFLLKLRQDSCSYLAFTFDSIADAGCATPGYISIQALNGQSPYSYIWNTVPPVNNSVLQPDSTGIFSVTASDGTGCTKTLSIQANIHITNSFNMLNVSSCDSFALNNQVYFSSGTYVQHLLNSVGCDSSIQLSLVINTPSASLISDTACYSYTLNSQIYTTSGTYTQTLPNAAGCDSTITLSLVVNNLVAVLTQNGITLTATTSGDSYQWIDCATNTAVAGENNQSFTATTNGNYAVIITENGCSDTSACYTINSVGLKNTLTGIAVSLVPNPTNGTIMIRFERAVESAGIEITNLMGQVIAKEQIRTTNSLSMDIPGPAGLYFVTITDNKGYKTVVKVVKQ
jgi:hypothetical protein